MKYFVVSYILGISSVIFASKADKTNNEHWHYLLSGIMLISIASGFFILGIQSGDDWYQIPAFTGLVGLFFYFLTKDFYERIRTSVQTTEKLAVLCPALKERKRINHGSTN